MTGHKKELPMAIFIMSDENLRVLKNVLMTDFEIRSSHASEGIAALCGFKTNAAMKADIQKHISPVVSRLNFENFEARLQKFGYDDDYALDYLRTVYRYIDFPDKAWGTFKRSQEKLRDDWFYECERKNIPFITINKKIKYCTLEWDCNSLAPQHDKHAIERNGDVLAKRMFHFFQMTSQNIDAKAWFDGSAFVGQIEHLSEASARMIADQFFLLLSPWRLESLELAST
jgi:hypothetical protein